MKDRNLYKRTPTENNIELEAYLLWEKAGKPEGMSDYFWNKAKEKCGAKVETKETKVTSYVCSNCGCGCYYDGRMGDGPILMCCCGGRAIDAASYVWCR
jgi:hypothetical protein